MTSPHKAECRVRSAHGSSEAWGRDRMNQTHRKGRKGAKRRVGGLRRLLDKALSRVEAWLEPEDEKVCDCLDPWTCGRPHAGSAERDDEPLGAPALLAIDGLAPLSEKEEAAFNSCMCPRCRHPVNPLQWKLQCDTMLCPWCDHLVD